MRRSERAITELEQIRALLEESKVVHLGIGAEGAPYVVPLNYGYDLGPDGKLTLYLHSAPQGRKLDLLRREARVGFAVSALLATVRGEVPCAWSARYRSLIGTGTVTFLEGAEEKREALQTLLRHMGFPGRAEMPEASLRGVAVLRLDVDAYTCKGNLP